jgi:hypothetical protein
MKTLTIDADNNITVLPQGCSRSGAAVMMNVIVTYQPWEEGTYMKTFTIDDENNITAFATQEEAAATRTTLSISSLPRMNWPNGLPRGRPAARGHLERPAVRQAG